MLRAVSLTFIAVLSLVYIACPAVAEIEGDYIEARTCDVYTGPCFANGEMGLAGKQAIMAWKVFKGDYQDVDLKGLSVLMVISAKDTIGFRGVEDVSGLQSMIVVDENANKKQRESLVAFAKAQAGKAGDTVTCVETAPIALSLDTFEFNGSVKAGKFAELAVRKVGKQDCICTNETGFYPPLTKLEHFAPGVTTDGTVSARQLKTRWEIPGSRSAYLGTFRYKETSDNESNHKPVHLTSK